MELSYHYGVRKIYGFCNGYQGFIPQYQRGVIDLSPEVVCRINEHGGTILGTSRGDQDPEEIVDCLDRMNIPRKERASFLATKARKSRPLRPPVNCRPEN